MQKSVRMLAIEDSEDDFALLSLLVRQAGYVGTIERVDTSKALAQALCRNWDIIISDHSMPRLSGSEALTMVRALNSEVPFIFVSGTIGEDVAVDAMRHGAQDYVMKSNLKRLIPAIQRELSDAEERAARKKAKRRVQQLEKYESIGRLVGGIAHDFNNTIGAILGWAELGRDETPAENRARDRFLKICAQTVRAGKLTSQLLAFAGGQILQPRKLNLNPVVEEEMSLLGRVVGEDIEVRIQLASDLPQILADASQIEQLLMNLCLNARDAMPAGGRLTVKTQNVVVDAAFRQEHPLAQPGNFVLLSVSDTGTGIDNASMQYIFEPFFTTKTGKATGLGLATVHNIVKQHGGFIVADNVEGGGASFCVYLPIAAKKHDDSEATQLNAPPRGTETILLAESHEGLRCTAQEMLQSLGYQVEVCADGKQALDLFRENPDRIDLLVMEVVMPALSGPQAYLEMCALKPDTRVIFTTGYTPKPAELASMMEKGAPLLRKPYSLISLSQMIRGVLEKPAVAAPSVLAFR